MGQREAKTLTVNRIKECSQKSLQQSIRDINTLARNVSGIENYVVFILIHTTDVEILFEKSSKIICTRINRTTRTIECCTYLSVAQFLQIAKTIQDYIDVIVDTKMQNIRYSIIREGSGSDECCCICYENLRNRVLPCCHSFCAKCIDQWLACKVECPICRLHIGSVTDEWIVTDFPNLTDIMVELRELLENISNENKILY